MSTTIASTPSDGISGASGIRGSLYEQLSQVERLTMQFFFTLGTLAMLFSIANSFARSSEALFLQTFGLLLATIMSAAASGGFLGFLFGIPRQLQRAAGDAGGNAAAPPTTTTTAGSIPSIGGAAGVAPIPAANASARIYRNNTNLEEISDWITKIIVGLGLVQATTIWEKVWSLAGKFNEGIQNAGGGDVLFVLTVAAASIGCFLFFYLETRTRILLLLLDTEAASDHPEIARKFDKSSNAPITDLPATATTGSRPSNRAIAAPEVASDREVRSVPYSSLQTADQRAAWAAAQARAGNFPAATDAIRVAVQQKPKDPVLRVKLADIYILQQLWESALVTLKEAEQISPNDDDILKRELYVSLYLEPPQSFRTALPIAEKLISNPNTANDPAVRLWQAAALGQKFKYLYDAGESLSSAGETESAESVRSKALQAVRAVVQLAPDPNSAPRIFLRRIFDPAREQSPPAENDLEVFKGDADFELAIYGGEQESRAPAGHGSR